MDKKNVVGKTFPHYEFPDLKELRKGGSEQEVLTKLETELKNLIQIKKRLKIETQARIKEEIARIKEEINKQFEKEWQKITRFENQMILLWDFHQREVEILSLEKQLKDKSFSLEQEEVARKKKEKLILINTRLAEGYKKEEVDKEKLAELRKKLGA